jgi:hypothetical protein
MRLAALLLLIATPAAAQQLTQPQPSAGPLPSETITTRELSAILAERDRQYAQRFEAQEKANAAALAAQERATATAFAAAEKAVAAALAAQEKATAAAFAAANEAVKTAQNANEKRLDNVNEFRAQQKDLIAILAPRAEMDVRFKAVGDKVDENSKSITEIRSEAKGASTLWAAMAVVIGLLLSLTVAVVALFRRRHPDRTETA